MTKARTNRRIDQAPHYQYPDNHDAPTDVFPVTSIDAGAKTPDRQHDNSSTPKWVKWGGAAVLAAVSVSTARYGMGYMEAKGQIDAVNDALGGDRSASAAPFPNQTAEALPPVPGDLNGDRIVTSEEYDQMSPEAYAELDEQARVEDSAEAFNTHLASAWETIQKYGNLTPEQREVLYMPDLNKPRDKWSDQDYLNWKALVTWLVTTQGESQGAKDEGRRALSVIVNPETNAINFDRLDTSIKNGEYGVKSIYRAIPTTPLSNVELTPTNVGSVQIDQNGGRAVRAEQVGNPNDDSGITIIFANRADSKGNIVSVASGVIISTWDRELVNLVTEQGRR